MMESPFRNKTVVYSREVWIMVIAENVVLGGAKGVNGCCWKLLTDSLDKIMLF